MKYTIGALVLAALPSLLPAGTYKNPVLPGSYPDPSVCRVGDDYYLVNSSFQYYPAVPVHHSKDLVNWKNIGYCIDRPSQIPLRDVGAWTGIYAPSIRHNRGMFYMTTTLVPKGGNFYVTSENPAGPWSDPVWVRQGGIDPDIFFDDDGKVYFLSAMGGAFLSEIDIKTGELKTEPRQIWAGTGGRYAEAPHIYKKDGYYYLLMAEGGTEYGHMATIARSRSIYGPYEENPANPILTHRGREGAASPIQCVGHADFVEAHDGSWWAVFLGVRPQNGMHHQTGRETYLAPVSWPEGGWPVVNKNGTVSQVMDCPTLPPAKVQPKPPRDNFDAEKLSAEWNHICIPDAENYSLSERPGFLRMYASGRTLDESGSPSFVGRRQQQNKFSATAALDVSALEPGSSAGITAFKIAGSHYDLAVKNRGGKKYVTVDYRLPYIHSPQHEIPLSSDRVCLRIEGGNGLYSFFFSADGKSFEKLGDMDAKYISTETAGGFTGVMIGLFAHKEKSQDKPSRVDFDWFEYRDSYPED